MSMSVLDFFVVLLVQRHRYSITVINKSLSAKYAPVQSCKCLLKIFDFSS